MPNPDILRTFIAIDTPPEFKLRTEILVQELARLSAPVAWEEPYKLHLTLRFLGDTRIETLEQVKERLGNIAATHKPFWLRYDGLGFFPHRRNPRIIWVGCSPLSAALERLQMDVEALAVSLGFEPERRPFSPHITIGRIRTANRSTADLIKKIETVTFDAVESEAHTLMFLQSRLQPRGSVYSILQKFSFTF